MTKIFNISTSIILFLPITIFYFLAVIFNNLFMLFNTFHRRNFWYYDLPLKPSEYHLIDSSTKEFFMRVIIIITCFFSNIWQDLKLIKYEL